MIDLISFGFRISHPVAGMIDLDPYDYQWIVLNHLRSGSDVIINHARQLGISTLLRLHALEHALGQKDANVMYIGSRQRVALNWLKGVRWSYKGMSSGTVISALVSDAPVLPQLVRDNQNEVEFSNGSKVFIDATSGYTGACSESLSLLIVDGAAYLDQSLDSALQMVLPSMRQNSQVIIASTPKVGDNGFYELWSRAELRQTRFQPIMLPWHVHPTLRPPLDSLSKEQIETEYLCRLPRSG